MTTRTPNWKVGCAYPVPRGHVDEEQDLVLDREALAELSPELKVLLSGQFVHTLSPDWPAVCLYSLDRWNDIFPKLLQLPSSNAEARQLQRRMIAHAVWVDESEPLALSEVLAEYTRLDDQHTNHWLICFDEDNAELWSEHYLLGMDDLQQPKESHLIRFFRGEGADHLGRTMSDALALNDFWLEHTHDVIQWLFPIPEPSQANAFAPVLTDADRECFRQDSSLRERHREALDRLLAFFGLTRNGDLVEALPGLNPRDHIWLKAGGHNHLRITRVIRSLHYCHQPVLARTLQAAFIRIGRTQGYVGEQTIGYWLRANE